MLTGGPIVIEVIPAKAGIHVDAQVPKLGFPPSRE
jgi:hypothetical protein